MNNSLCKDLLCIILVIGLSILLYKLFQQDEYEGQSNISNYKRINDVTCGIEGLPLCSSGTKAGTGIEWGNMNKSSVMRVNKECDSDGKITITDLPLKSGKSGNAAGYTAEECANKCKEEGGKYISHGRDQTSGNSDDQCTKKGDKCRCNCHKTCNKPEAHNSYRIYDLDKLKLQTDNCKEISWAREKQITGGVNKIDGNNKHCPLIPSNFNIQNASNLCNNNPQCVGFTDYRGATISGDKNKVCFWKDVNPSEGQGSNTWCYIKKSEMQRIKDIKEEEEQQNIADAVERLRSSIGKNYDKDGCAKDEKFFWNDEIIEGGDNPNYGRSLVNNMNECKLRCINDYNCAYYKYSSGKISGKHSCHIFKEPSRYSSKKAYNSKNDKICKVKHPVHKFSKNKDTIRCMSRSGEVVGTKLIGGDTKSRSKYVKTKKQEYSIEGTKNIVEDTKENCHYNCFKDDKCKAYSWIPINEEKGKCYHFNKTEVNQTGFRKMTLKDGGIRKGHSVLNKNLCMADIKNKDIVKYTDILRSEFNKFPCNPLCVREKVNKDSRSSKINYQEKVIAEKISDIRYHSAFILLNDSSNEEIKGIYMIDMDDWIKERKIYLFKKNLYKKQFPNDNTFSEKYSHKITWVNQKNNGFKIIVDVERDKDDIIDTVTKLRIIKNKKLYSLSAGFLQRWSDPTLTINFLGWNKGQWKSSHINMLRKIEKKITSYNYCDDKMKNGKLWTGGVNALCYYPSTKKYDSKEDVTLSSIDTLSDQKSFLTKMELCTSRDGGMPDCEILNSSPRFK